MLRQCVLLLIFLITLSSKTYGELQRHALVIGNSNYHQGRLINPRNDARDMAQALNKLGYKIFREKAHLNLDLEQMEQVLLDFSNSLDDNVIALLYFAGHGISANGENYLIPLNAKVRWEAQLTGRAVSVNSIVQLLKSSNRKGLNVLLLDACRDNPLENSFGRSGSRGLVRNRGNLPHGTFIGYAADQNQTAADGRGRNGTYTEALLKAMQDSAHLPIELAHKKVAARVLASTRNGPSPQFPVADQKFIGDYCFGDCESTSVSVRPNEISFLAMHKINVRKGPGTEFEIVSSKQYGEKIIVVGESDDGLWVRIALDIGSAGYVLKRLLTVQLPEKMSQVNEDSQSSLSGVNSFSDCSICPEMTVIRAGTFTMGSKSNSSYSDEMPLHRVTLSQDFAVGVYEITFREWDACVKDGGCDGYMPSDESWGRADRPVINVSWLNAQSYISWLNQKTGKNFRLLSESEWEYMARASTTTKFTWGSHVGIGNANCLNCGNNLSHGKTQPVGSYKANNFGIFDVHGNVLEWVADCYDDNYKNAPNNGSVNRSGKCRHRVLRGGSWQQESDRNLSVSTRFSAIPSRQRNIFGFRVALDLH